MFKNSKTSYGWVVICIHWLMALSIFAMFGLGLYMVELTYYDAWYKGSLDLHKGVGVILFFALMFRVFWRFINVTPESVDKTSSQFLKIIAKLIHVALYLFMFILMSSGYLISTADGRSIDVFGIFSLPALPISFENQEDITGLIHEFFAWTLIAIATVHTLAALKHHFINKNDTLIRMFKVKH